MRLFRLAHAAQLGAAVSSAAAVAAAMLGARVEVVAAASLALVFALTTSVLLVRRDRLQRAMYASLREVASSADVRAVLTTVARRAADALGAIDGVVMIRRGDDLRTYTPARTRIEPLANAIGLSAFTAQRELPSVRVLRTGQAVSISDVSAYEGPPGFHEACARAGVRAVLCVPLTTAQGTIGSLNLGFASARRFGPADLGLASAYAEQAATGLERAEVFELEQEARRALQELEDLKTTFLESVTNELHTPLTSICGYSDLLVTRWEALTGDQQRDFTVRIAAQSKVLAARLDDLLEVRGLTSTALGRLEPIDIRLLVVSTVAGLLDELDGRRVAIEVDPGVIAWTHPAAFGRILRSLLINAVQYSPIGSVIRVGTRASADTVTVDVRDEGIGIRAIDIERIFDPFYRGGYDDTTPPGAGLGLPLARRYAEAMGGKLWVQSTSGVGSTFSFSLLRSPRRIDDPSTGDVQTLQADPSSAI